MSWWSGGDCVVDEDTLKLTLEADGTLSGTFQGTAPTFQSTSGQDPWTCGDQIFVEGPYEVAGWHTPATLSERGDVFVEIVGWSDWHIEGEYSPSEMKFEWEIRYEATGYEGDEPNPQVVRVVDYTLSFNEA